MIGSLVIFSYFKSDWIGKNGWFFCLQVLSHSLVTVQSWANNWGLLHTISQKNWNDWKIIIRQRLNFKADDAVSFFIIECFMHLNNKIKMIVKQVAGVAPFISFFNKFAHRYPILVFNWSFLFSLVVWNICTWQIIDEVCVMIISIDVPLKVFHVIGRKSLVTKFLTLWVIHHV